MIDEAENWYNTAIQYKQRLSAVWVNHIIMVLPEWDTDNPIVLNCKHIDAHNPPQGFVSQGHKYQYDLRQNPFVLGRRIAWRTPFIDQPGYWDDSYTVSHLCHNNQCYNWNHHTLETLDVNKARMGCAGGPHCFHKVKCIRPGPCYNK
jgi:hypothetical protein